MSDAVSPPGSPPDERILRPTGKFTPKGRVMTGSTAHQESRPATSSIPTKFETIFNAGVKELDGFNTRTTRFNRSEVRVNINFLSNSHTVLCRQNYLAQEIIINQKH